MHVPWASPHGLALSMWHLTSKPARESVCRESASKMEVTDLYHVFKELLSHHLCLSLLLRSKSQVLPKVKLGEYTRA